MEDRGAMNGKIEIERIKIGYKKEEDRYEKKPTRMKKR